MSDLTFRQMSDLTFRQLQAEERENGIVPSKLLVSAEDIIVMPDYVIVEVDNSRLMTPNYPPPVVGQMRTLTVGKVVVVPDRLIAPAEIVQDILVMFIEKEALTIPHVDNTFGKSLYVVSIADIKCVLKPEGPSIED